MSYQNQDPIGKMLSMLLMGMWQGLKSIYKGLKKLNKPANIAALAVTIIVSVLSYIGKAKFAIVFVKLEVLTDTRISVIIQKGFWGIMIALPVIFLMILGQIESKVQNIYEKIFKDIGFIGKNNKIPYFLWKKEIDKKTIYAFQSNIPLSEWNKARERLELGLECSIRRVCEGSKKNIVELITVSSDYKIPEEIAWDDSYIQDEDGVIVIGESDLDIIKFDLNRTPHVLFAGETGSGKSVAMRLVFWQMVKKKCKPFMVDFKGGVEFGKKYERYGEVITDRKRALEVLTMLVKENEARLKLFRDLEVKNLKEYNYKTHQNLSRIGVFIDEVAELLDKKGVAKEDKPIYEKIEALMSTLARLSRATGINLILGVQRPDANILTGQIKNNIPVRISGRFADKTASEIVLGNIMACNLPDVKGRFLYKVGNETIEFQSYFFNDDRDLKEIDITECVMLTNYNNSTREQTQEDRSNKKDIKTSNKAKSLAKEDIDLDLNFKL